MYTMKTDTTSCCGLDLQKDYFSIVQYSAAERAVTLLSIKSFSDREDNDVWKAWKEELKKNRGSLRFFNPAVVCGMPSEHAVVKLVPLDADEEHAGETVEWELGQQIGGSLDEYVFDFQEPENGPRSAERKVLAVAYRRELVNRVADLVRNVNLQPQVVDLDIFGLVNVFSANYRERTDTASLLVHSESEMTKLVMTRRGGFMNFHCFEHKSGSVDPAGYASLLSSEIDRFCAVTKENGGRPDIFITGSYFQQDISREAFFEKAPGAELLDPFRAIKCQVKIDEHQIPKYSTQLAVAVGLALRGAGSTAS
jgi:Tfp pilus assembly PilM family ATPase